MQRLKTAALPFLERLAASKLSFNSFLPLSLPVALQARHAGVFQQLHDRQIISNSSSFAKHFGSR